MIFNPLYFSESGNSHMLVANSSKLSNKQYLFSDIVKVIMNSDRDQKKIMETGLDQIATSQLPDMAGISNESKQIKFSELSKKDHEKVKTSLVDILPPEIAQLLMNNNMILKNGEALSYISEEPLSGDLENFIKGLVGEDVLKENITNKSGLFLHLEDSKSAVNIELKKAINNGQANNKIIVQTLVVPEKSKLFSLFKTEGSENNNTKIQTNNLPLTNPLGDISLTNAEQNEDSLKPTLAVYSFKNPQGEMTSLLGEKSDNIKLEFANSNLIASSKNNYASKIPLDKISFIPSELKGRDQSSEKGEIAEGIIGKGLNLASNKVQENADNEFNVTKITIVKKQNNTASELIQKLQKEDKKIDSSLRRIDFKSKFDPNKNELLSFKNNVKNLSDAQPKIYNVKYDVKTTNIPTELNTKNEQNANHLKTLSNDQKSVGTIEKTASSENNSTKPTIQKELNNIQSSKSNLNQMQLKNIVNSLSTDEKTSSKNNIAKENDNTVKVNTSGEIKSESTIKTEAEKLDNEIIGNSKKINFTKAEVQKTETSNNQSEQNSKKVVIDASKVLDKTEKSVSDADKNLFGKILNVQDDLRKSEILLKNNEKDSPKIEVKSEKSIIENLNKDSEKINSSSLQSDSEKLAKKETNNKLETKNIQKPDKTDNTVKTNNTAAVNVSNNENQTHENKKISVKVRGEIKSVTNKVDNGNNSFVEQSNNNSTETESDSQDKNFSSSIKSAVSALEKDNNKNDHDVSFGNTLKDEIVKDVDSLKKAFSQNESGNAQKYVKSSEVMKEITKFITKQDKGTLSFDIKPEHLGKMKITLDTVDHAVKATIHVENEHAKSLVEKNIQKLQQDLNNNGVQLSSINISLGQPKNHRNERHNYNKNENRNSDYKQGDIDISDEEIKDQKTFGYNTYEYIA